jgi:hypothetical protein
MVQDAKSAVLGSDEMGQRINDLQERRKCDKINLILYAAARGDLVSLKDAMEVNIYPSIVRKRSETAEVVSPQNGDVNACDSLCRTPMHVAASEGQVVDNFESV